MVGFRFVSRCWSITYNVRKRRQSKEIESNRNNTENSQSYRSFVPCALCLLDLKMYLVGEAAIEAEDVGVAKAELDVDLPPQHVDGLRRCEDVLLP